MTAETQVNAQTLPIGYVIDDYRITALLGQGGFGITYKAADDTLQRSVAIKEYMPQQFAYRDGAGQIRPRSDGDAELFEWGLNRFVDEGRALARFRHPNIASVIRYVQRSGTAYLVMEFEEGMDLERWVAGRDRPAEDRLVKGILVPVLEGLALVHDKGLLHRDIKPDNIFIRRDGTPVLIDFGASRPHGPEAASRLTSIISAGYSPFEQYGSGERQGPWSDLYALAGTIYRVICGQPPTDAIARQQGVPLTPAVEVGAGHYSPRLLETLDQALSLDIGQRPQDARQFLTMLGVEPPAADPDATQVRLTPPPGAPRGGRRGWLAAGLLVAAVAAGGAFVVVGTGLLDGDPAPAGPGPDSTAGTGTGPGRAAEETAGTLEGQRQADGGPDNAGTRSDVAGEGSGQNPATQEASRTPADPADAESSPDRLSEDRILAGLNMPGALQTWRRENLQGRMLAYTHLKTQFDECVASGCPQQGMLFQRLQQAGLAETLKPKKGEAEQTIAIEKPRRLEDNDDCPFMLDIREILSFDDVTREQVRTYCTSNGYERRVEEAGDVERAGGAEDVT